MKTLRVIKIAAVVACIATLAFLVSRPLVAGNTDTKSTEENLSSVPEDIRKNVESTLVAPLRKKYYGKALDDDREFSRCPSGVHSNFAGSEKVDGYYTGTVAKWTGCSRKEVCKFRANETTVEVETPDGYVEATKWLNNTIKSKEAKEI